MIKTVWILAAFVLLGLGGCAVKDAGPEKTAVSEPLGQNINAYYYAAFADSATVRQNLETAGFEIVGTYPATQNSEVIIITSEALKAAADKPGRGFAAILRVLIDRENKRVAVTNPVYFGKAFLQETYNPALATQLTETLTGALGALSASPDVLNYDVLAGYQFMVGMPHYADTYVLAEGDTETLIDKVDAYKDGQAVVFKLVIGDGRVLIGFDLDKRTKRFVKKIGVQNAEVLPYTILIGDGRATALAAKYYLALSYPLLKMGEFMTIATVPGAVERELQNAFE